MSQFILRYLRAHPVLLYFGIAVLTVAAVLLTLIPANYIVASRVLSYDKLGHLLLFGSWTFMIGLYRLIHYPEQARAWKTFLLGLLFGGFIELLQLLMPINRHADWADLGFDALGSLAAALLLKYLFNSTR